jgi:hypothetical protein
MGLSPISSVILLLSPMKFYIGITDEGWFRSLSSRNAFEGNFWRPGGTPFKVLEPGDFFLFKLKSPKNALVGGGQFVHYSRAFSSFAWDAFGLDNGVESNLEFLKDYSLLEAKIDQVVILKSAALCSITSSFSVLKTGLRLQAIGRKTSSAVKVMT